MDPRRRSPRRRPWFPWILVAGLVQWQAAAAQEAFFATLSDLPLMVGLEELTDSALIFDTPGGRLVEFSAAGSVTRQAILAFYGGTLPQLGWRPMAEGRFEREGEILRLSFGAGDGATLVTFALAPAVAAAP